ncbi:MAG: glycoside hydrolase N-terminal domain-containing protein [Candidatus Acidiferrales bacterium]
MKFLNSAALVVLILAFPALQAAAQDRSAIPAPRAISVNSLIPADQRVSAMPLAERERLHAVPRRGICNTIPAAVTQDGLFSGNGTMNISVFGVPFAEQVLFNHEDLVQPWKTGKPMEAPKIAYVLPEVRRLMLQGEYRKALDLSLDAAAKAGLPPGTGYPREHPAFVLRINSAGQHAVTNYLRTLDFESGEVKVVWTDNAGTWERRSFVSRPDNVVVQSLNSPPGGSLNVDIQLDTSTVLHPHPVQSTATPSVPRPYHQHEIASQPGASEIHFTRDFSRSNLVLQGRYVVDSGNPGYAAVTRVVAAGGQVSVESETLHVRGARSLLLLTRIEVYPDITQAAVDGLQRAVDQVTPDYGALLERHRPQQAEVLDRVSVDFGGAPFHSFSGEELLTDQRTRQGFNPALLENLFDMGRYWLYARSGRFSPIWGHINVNINLQMSGAAMGNLPEATQAFVRWVESLLPDSRVNAENIFGARGILFAAHPIQTSGALEHFEFTWPHHYWISGAGWVYNPIWDYYLVSGDRQFLREHILPSLKEIALFYEDYLKETDAHGNYVFVPSYSPENWPANSEGSPAVINADMDIAVCREVFTHLIQAAQVLGTDSDSIPKWQAILSRLPPYVLDTDGALKEWAWPSLEENQDHRHVSHLYGVWPADEITPDQTPELARAAWLAARKRAQGNESAHGMLHRSLAATRLKDPWLVTFDLKELLEQGYVNASLTTNHNPYVIPSPDPQGALPTIMMEMLVYSRPGVVELLPAIPVSLRQGSAQGILCRTRAKIDNLQWDLDSKKLEVTISSPIDQTLSLVVRRGIEAASTGQPDALIDFKPGTSSVTLHLAAGRALTIHLTVGDHLPSDWIVGK